MAISATPAYLQNASHSAAIFRGAVSAPFVTGGTLSTAELPVTQQGTPNMSVVLGPGRAMIVGTAVSPPAGQSWTTQGDYYAYNDANLTLTVAASDPTNPRIDAVYIQIQDSFYSGSNNQAVAGISTGTPAPTPGVPAIPTNALLIAYLAVGANVTSIVTANITYQALAAQLLPPNLFANAAALKYTGAGIPATNGTSTPVTFDSTDIYNYLTDFTYARSTGILTCARAGTYRFEIGLIWGSSATGIRQILLSKALAATPTTYVVQSMAQVPAASGIQSQSGIWFVTLAVGDNIQFEGAQSSGGTLNMGPVNLGLSRIA